MSMHDWSRRALLMDNDVGFGFYVIDGVRATGAEVDAFMSDWLDSLPDKPWPVDPIGAQCAAAHAYRIARENPGDLDAPFLAAWQRHAHHVARCARAEVIRMHGGTGAELTDIEAERTLPSLIP